MKTCTVVDKADNLFRTNVRQYSNALEAIIGGRRPVPSVIQEQAFPNLPEIAIIDGRQHVPLLTRLERDVDFSVQGTSFFEPSRNEIAVRRWRMSTCTAVEEAETGF